MTETLEHILWCCPSAMDVWTECSIKFQKYSFAPISFIHLLEILMERLDVKELQFFAVVARQLWLRGNSFVFGSDFHSPSRVICLAKEQMQAFLSVEQL